MHRLHGYRYAALIAATALAAACSRGDNRAVDTAGLAADLQSASQTPARLDTVSPIEQGQGPAAVAPTRSASSGSSTARRSTSRARTSTASRTSAASSGDVATGSSGSSAPTASRTEVVKHTKRDAAIGAAAGAVIGATTSKDKVKGGVIGAAAGAVLGGVIGNNVDKKKKKVP